MVARGGKHVAANEPIGIQGVTDQVPVGFIGSDIAPALCNHAAPLGEWRLDNAQSSGE